MPDKTIIKRPVFDEPDMHFDSRADEARAEHEYFSHFTAEELKQMYAIKLPEQYYEDETHIKVMEAANG
jgi:hypothetical protein